jgi:phosphatidylserine/phosphatidylglycerophosphate/cardiolipin synthase-like enzyme
MREQAQARQSTTGWPWRPGNDFRLLDGGAVFFPRMLAAIDAARMHVLLEMYLVTSGRVAGQFIASSSRSTVS